MGDRNLVALSASLLQLGAPAREEGLHLGQGYRGFIWMRQDNQEPRGKDRDVKVEGVWGQKEGLGWGTGEMAEGSREEELELTGRTALFQCFILRPAALHPDAYLMSSYSASVPMIW